MASESRPGRSVYENVKHATNQFALLRDEIRLQMHLANMEARSSFERLEPHLRRIQQQMNDSLQQLEQKEDETELKLHLALMDANTRFLAMEEWLRSRLRWLQDKKSQAQISWDTSRIQMHLAAMDAEDFMQEKSSQVKAKIREAKTQAVNELRETSQQLAERISSLRNGIQNPPNDSIDLKS